MSIEDSEAVRAILFLRASLEAALARRRAAAVLAALSDRQLADAGFDRSEIEARVRVLWPPPVWTAERRPSHRPSLQGCG